MAAGLLLPALLALGVAVLGRHAPPFREISDGAVLEIYTLEAMRGSLLVGPYSRFGWHHPGPLFFYFEAPWYWLSGRHTLGMQAGALLINLGAFAALAWTALKYGSPATVAALALAVALFVYRTGDLIVSVWNPHVVILPLLAFILAAAAYAARGDRRDLFLVVLIGSFLVQTHLAMGAVVGPLGILAAAAQHRRRREAWIPAAGLAIGLWAPSFIEQMTSTPGNLTRIVKFFLTTSSSGPSLDMAAAAWSDSLTSVFRRSFVVAMGFDFHPAETSWPLIWASLQVLALVITTVLARRRDDFAAWLSLMCALTASIALLATTQIRDRIVDHEIFWMSALGALNVAVIVGGLMPRRFPRFSIVSLAWAAALVVVTTAGIVGIRHSLERNRTPDDRSVDVLTASIQQALDHAGARRPLFRIEQDVWPIAAGALLQLRKAGLSYAVDDRWTIMFGEAFARTGREDAQLTIGGSPRLPRLVSVQ